MAVRICILGSGSSGNCTYVGSRTASILIDAGLSGKETKRRLEQIAVKLEDINGICLSHEHGDHTGGIGVLHRRYGIPVYANSGTIDGLSQNSRLKDLGWTVFVTGSAFRIGDLQIEPFSVPHDAYEPVGFIIGDGSVRIGIVTDMGAPTALIRERLKCCNAVVVEANHDEQLLEESSRPWALKQRIRGRQGHLSNKRAAEMMAEIAGPHLCHIFLAHLSADCNRRDLAVSLVQKNLSEAGHEHVGVSCAFPDRISDIWAHPSFHDPAAGPEAD